MKQKSRDGREIANLRLPEDARNLARYTACMDKDILEYIQNQRVCVIALEMPDGSPHAATVHFAHGEDPLTFVFMTDRKYKKGEALLEKELVRASVVVGTSEEDQKTLQMDGIARKITRGNPLWEAYFMKFPKKREKYNGPDDLFFSFTPTWWRFTDWTAPEGKTVRTG